MKDKVGNAQREWLKARLAIAHRDLNYYVRRLVRVHRKGLPLTTSDLQRLDRYRTAVKWAEEAIAEWDAKQCHETTVVTESTPLPDRKDQA